MRSPGPLVSAFEPAAYPVGALDPAQQGIAFLVGVVLMLIGVYLRWRLPHERMAVEEYAKERRMTEQQARCRVQLIRFGGPISVLLGLAAFATIFWE